MGCNQSQDPAIVHPPLPPFPSPQAAPQSKITPAPHPHPHPHVERAEAHTHEPEPQPPKEQRIDPSQNPRKLSARTESEL